MRQEVCVAREFPAAWGTWATTDPACARHQRVYSHLPLVPAGVVTLPDANVLIVGGVAHNGQGGWQALPDRRAEYDNPT